MHEETLKHIHEVSDNINKLISKLNDRRKSHDASKLETPECDGFAKVSSKLKGLTYGSNEYNDQLKEMKPFLSHHYANNRHHPEYHSSNKCPCCLRITTKVGTCTSCDLGVELDPYGIYDMNLIDICEMLMDWVAATKRHADGDILKSIEINQRRFGYTNELKQIFINTVKSLDMTNKEK